jgi:1-phosphofructokinase family hexose kinase
MIATITLNPSIDQHIFVRGLVKDDANRAISVFRYPGGKGINVSKVVRELGGPTHAYAMLGGFSGDLLKTLAEPLGISLTSFAIDGDTRINSILTDLKDHTQTRISDSGPWVSEKSITKFLKRLLAVQPKPFLWALGGSLSKGMPPSTYERFIRALQKAGMPCVLDADGEALKCGIRAKPFMIKPNEYEFKRLLGGSFKSLEDYLKGARSLVKRGLPLVVVSLGGRGALFVSAKEAFHVSSPNVKVKSKVGAGDSLIGGLTLGLYRKMSLKKAACLGVAASTSAVMREAPRLCFRKDIPGLLRRIKPRDLW